MRNRFRDSSLSCGHLAAGVDHATLNAIGETHSEEFRRTQSEEISAALENS